MLIHQYAVTLNGTEAGSFSYEATGDRRNIGLPLVDLEITWQGVTYTEAEFGWAYLLDDGRLDLNFGSGAFGTTCDPGGCPFSASPAPTDWMVYWQYSAPIASVISGFRYAENGTRQTGEFTLAYLGSYEWEPPVSVPEPSTFLLLGIGLAMFRCARGFAGQSRR